LDRVQVEVVQFHAESMLNLCGIHAGIHAELMLEMIKWKRWPQRLEHGHANGILGFNSVGWDHSATIDMEAIRRETETTARATTSRTTSRRD